MDKGVEKHQKVSRPIVAKTEIWDKYIPKRLG